MRIEQDRPLSVISSPPQWQWKELMLGNSTDWSGISFDPAFAAQVEEFHFVSAWVTENYPIPPFSLVPFTSLRCIDLIGACWNQPTLTAPATVTDLYMDTVDGVMTLDLSACSMNDVEINLWYYDTPDAIKISHIKMPAVTGMFVASSWESSGGPITTLTVPPAINLGGDTPPILWFNGNSLTQASVNGLLVALAAGTSSGGDVDLSGGLNAAPGAAGLAAKATLVGRGWTVRHN